MLRTVHAVRSVTARYLDLRIAQKVWIGFALVFGVALLSSAIAVVSVSRLEDVLRYVTNVAEPMSAAAYEMEINAIGSGLGVLAYLHDPDAAFLSRFEEDKDEFRAFQERFAEVAPFGEARRLGRRAGQTYEAFRALGVELIADKDREVQAFRRLGAVLGELDRLLDRGSPLGSGQGRPRSPSPGQYLALFRAELGALSLWVTNHLGGLKPGLDGLSQLRRRRADVERRLGALALAMDDAEYGEVKARLETGARELLAATDEIVAIKRSMDANLARFAQVRSQLDDILDEEVQIFAQAQLLEAETAAHGLARGLQFGLFSFTVLFALVAIGSSVSISRSVLGPVRALADGTQALGGGRLDHRIRVDSNDEMGELARAFNQMAARLQQASDRLEREVQRQTADLRVSKQSIEQELAKRRLLEEQLLQAQKMESLGTLAGGIAHDFNNMLYVIIGSAELADLALPADSPVRSHLDRVLQAGQRSKALVQKILSFSRANVPDLKPVRIEQVVRGALTLLRGSVPRTIAIAEDIAGDCGLVLADAGQLEQVIVNITVNSVQAINGNAGSITVALRPIKADADLTAHHVGLLPGDYAELWVMDTGCGISEDILPRVLDPFFTTKPINQGTGLGLSVAHGVVTAHGGTIHVASKPGRGCKVTIWLPRLQDGQAHVPAGA